MNTNTTARTDTPRHRLGRPPKPVIVDSADAALLEQIVSSSFWPDFQVRKAKAILGMARGGRLCDVSTQLNYSKASIWRCRDRFRKGGVAALLMEGHRPASKAT